MNKHLIMNKNTFNFIPTDVIHIVSSFLLPRDLCRFRTLSIEYSKIITNYLIKTKKTVNLFNLICPMCGNDWIDTNNILDLNDFSDIDPYTHHFDIIERQKYIIEIFGENKNKRKHLLCSDCENNFNETYSLLNFKLPHTYQLYLDFYSRYQWACIVKIDDEGVYNWNQYNCLVQIENDDDDRHYRHYTAQELGLDEESDYISEPESDVEFNFAENDWE